MVLLAKLQKIQNKAVHILTRSEFDEDAEPLRWKTVRKLVRYDTALTMHKSMHNIAPSYLTNIVQPLKDVNQIKLRDTSANLRLPRVTMNMGLRSFAYKGVAFWNNWKPGKDGCLTPVVQTLAKPFYRFFFHLYS